MALVPYKIRLPIHRLRCSRDTRSVQCHFDSLEFVRARIDPQRGAVRTFLQRTESYRHLARAVLRQHGGIHRKRCTRLMTHAQMDIVYTVDTLYRDGLRLFLTNQYLEIPYLRRCHGHTRLRTRIGARTL